MFSEYQEWKKRQKEYEKETGYKQHIKDNSMFISDEGQKEYVELASKYLKVKKVPSNNNKVWITTHSGGKYVGYYEDEQWFYRTLEGNKIIEKAIVIKWEKYQD